MPQATRPLRPLDHARAALVLFHLIALALPSLPLPVSFDPRALDGATGQDQLRAWSAALSALGLPASQPALRSVVERAAPRLIAARRAALAPLDPYYDAFGTRQAWRLFSFIDQELAELHIDLVTQGETRPLYRPRSHEHRWMAETLDHERLRSLIASVTVSTWHRSTQAFVGWLAHEALRDHGDASAIRVGIFRRPAPTPQQARRGELPEGRYEPSWVIEREATP